MYNKLLALAQFRNVFFGEFKIVFFVKIIEGFFDLESFPNDTRVVKRNKS